MPAAAVRRFVDLSSTLGPRQACSVAARWLIRREYQIYCRDLRRPLPEIVPPAGLEWAPLTEAEIPRLRGLNPLMTEAEVRRRCREGQTCLLGRLGGALAHYRWDTLGPLDLPYLGRPFRPLPGDVFADESFTHPAFRGRGLDACGALMAYRQARARGCRRSITLVAWWNMPSRRTQARAGRALVGSVGYWWTGIGRRYFATGAACFDDSGALYLRDGSGQ
jgi:hypothetical protein